MSERPLTEVRSHLGISPQEARDLRAHALRYALDRYFEKQNPTEASSGHDDVGLSSEERRPA